MNVLLFIAIFAVVVAVIYILYCQGFAVLKRTAAIMMVFRRGKHADHATFDSCTGWIKHAGRFHESKTYEFVLEMQLSKGSVEVILLDRKKRELMKLDQHTLTGKIDLDARNRYYLRWEFKGATGKCELRW